MTLPSPTADDFIAAFAQFSGTDSGQVTTELAVAAAFLDSSVWDDLYPLGCMLLVAHELTINAAQLRGGVTGGIQAAIGPLSSSSAAGVSTSFNTVATDGKSSADWYNKTSYGQRFLRVQRVVAPLGFLA
jgi:hypothetical protein